MTCPTKIGRVPFVWMMLVPNITGAMRLMKLYVLMTQCAKSSLHADIGSMKSVCRTTQLLKQMETLLELFHVLIAELMSLWIKETTRKCLNGGFPAIVVQDI